jgi:hypothetical protein
MPNGMTGHIKTMGYNGDAGSRFFSQMAFVLQNVKFESGFKVHDSYA